MPKTGGILGKTGNQPERSKEFRYQVATLDWAVSQPGMAKLNTSDKTKPAKGQGLGRERVSPEVLRPGLPCVKIFYPLVLRMSTWSLHLTEQI